MRNGLTGGLFGCWLSVVAPLCAQTPVRPSTGINPIVPTSTLSGGNLVSSSGMPAPVIVPVASLSPSLPATLPIPLPVNVLPPAPATTAATTASVGSTSARPTPVFGYYQTQWRTFPGTAATLPPVVPPVTSEVTSRGAASDLSPVPSEMPSENPPLLPKHVENKPTIEIPQLPAPTGPAGPGAPMSEIERADYRRPVEAPKPTRPAVRINLGGLGTETPATPTPAMPSRPRLGIPTVD